MKRIIFIALCIALFFSVGASQTKQEVGRLRLGTIASSTNWGDGWMYRSANGDTLIIETGAQRWRLYIGAMPAIGESWQSNGLAMVPAVISGGGGGNDSILVIRYSDDSNPTINTDTLEFNITNFTKTGSGNIVIINTVQDIAPTSSPTFNQLLLTGDSVRVMTPSGSKTITIATQNTGFNPLFLLPTAASGTFVVSAATPLSVNATTGEVSLSGTVKHRV